MRGVSRNDMVWSVFRAASVVELSLARRLILWMLMATAPLQSQATPTDAARADTATILAALRAEDLRVAAIANRLTIANAELCKMRAARTGLQLHDLSQYAPGARGEARKLFRFAAPIAVEGVVPDSAADRAGVREDDSIASLNGEPFEAGPMDTGKDDSTDRVIAAEKRIMDAGLAGPIRLGLLRHGKAVDAVIDAPSGCASRFEVTVKDSYDARADGSIVQISTKMVESIAADDELAYVIAHEMAHNVLRHRDRLDAAGVTRGLIEVVGANVTYIRRSEIEADILGNAIAANAGYDPEAGARWWRWFGPAHFNSILLARTHPKWSTRAKLLDREAAAFKASSQRPYVPAILEERDKPMSKDWPALVAGLSL